MTDEYTTVGWKNGSDAKTTPVNATNLNKMDKAIQTNRNAIRVLETQNGDMTDIEEETGETDTAGILEKLYDMINNLTYKAGDSCRIAWYGAGFLTSSKTSIRITIPVKKTITATSVTITDMKIQARQNGVYVLGDADAGEEPTSITAYINNNCGLTIFATIPANSDATNNAPIGLAITATASFS